MQERLVGLEFHVMIRLPRDDSTSVFIRRNAVSTRVRP
jgi:hypothetical protein